MRLKAQIILYLSLLFFGSAVADERATVGQVTKFSGEVRHHINNTPKGIRINTPQVELKVNDNVRTKRDAQAYIALIDDSQIILMEKSSLHLQGIKQIKAEQGRVLFNIKKQEGIKGYQILTTSAVIGVKGTRFLVQAQDQQINVYMDEGVVSVESLRGEFKRFKQQQTDEFNTFKDQNQGEFDDFKKNLQEEFVEFVKSIDVSQGKAITIDGNELRESEIPADVQNLFLLFNNF